MPSPAACRDMPLLPKPCVRSAWRLRAGLCSSGRSAQDLHLRRFGCGRRATLACESPAILPHFAQISAAGDFMTIGGSKNVQLGLMLATVLSCFDLARTGVGLYARTAAGLQRRRVPPVWSGDSGRRSRHRLHDPQQVPALAGLSGVLQAGSRVRTKARPRRPAGRWRSNPRRTRTAPRRASRRRNLPRPEHGAMSANTLRRSKIRRRAWYRAPAFQVAIARQTDALRQFRS